MTNNIRKCNICNKKLGHTDYPCLVEVEDENCNIYKKVLSICEMCKFKRTEDILQFTMRNESYDV